MMREIHAFQHDFGLMLQSGDVPNDSDLQRAITIHRNTSLKAAMDALDANFPVLAALVGDGAFAACAWEYIERFPPTDPRLTLFGEHFPIWVGDWRPFQDAPYLAPVARLEQLVVESLFAADADALSPAGVSGALDPDMPLILHPATRVAAFDCPAASYWRAHQADSEIELSAIPWGPEIALVTRPGLAIAVQPIDRPTHAFLTAPTLGEAAVAANALGGNVAAVFSDLLLAGAFAHPFQQV
jgi:hypothetical protein